MKRLAFALLLAGAAGCSSMVNSALYGASDQAGRNIGASMVGNAGAQPASYNAGDAMNPAFLNMYMGVIFAYAFSSGGYDVAPVQYKPGQYTRWTGKGQNGKAITLERAFLFEDGHGRQWWKVKWTDDADKTIVLEGLLSPKEKRFVRMRAKFPEDAEGKELPVDEATYYHAPQKLSPESVEGATKGVEKVTVPAGSFKAKHVVFGGIDGTHEWWLDNKVPGGTVKQTLKSSKSDEDRWDMELAAYGSDAKSELGSK
jgi:hypothetical protein